MKNWLQVRVSAHKRTIRGTIHVISSSVTEFHVNVFFYLFIIYSITNFMSISHKMLINSYLIQDS